LKKIKSDNPSNSTLYYYCGRNLEEQKEVDNKIITYFDSVLATSNFMDFPLP
jgi:hypothetical protein